VTEHFLDYEIIKEMDRNSIAVFHRAHNTKLHRTFMLILLHPGLVDSSSFAARFRSEMRAISRLRHPNIPTVRQVGESEGQLYIATELIPARTLRDLLDEEGILNLEQAVPIVQQIAEVLDYFHGQEVLHGDLRPENVALEDTRRGLHVTLANCALLRMAAEEASLSSYPAGAIELWSPEQVNREGDVTVGPPSDLYSLGALAYLMLTGTPPFSGDAETTLQAISNDAPAPPSYLQSTLSDALDEVLLQMLAKSPKDRFPSAKAFADRLRTVMLTESQVVRIETRLSPLYERLKEAADNQDWREVVRIGELIQVLDAAYRDVPALMERAREELLRAQRD
jgi:serine/threonine-protein kinase